jgi:hypothetical protein
VIEKVESYGMAIGVEVFDTVLWAGRFAEAAHRVPVVMVPRRAVKLALRGDSRAKDANIRQALIEGFGGSTATCITSRSGQPTPVGGSWPSSMRPRSRSSPSIPARSSRPTASSPPRGTGATRDETPAVGRGPKRQEDHGDSDVPTHVTHMSRLMTVARPTGFEPATFGSGGRRSIH